MSKLPSSHKRKRDDGHKRDETASRRQSNGWSSVGRKPSGRRSSGQKASHNPHVPLEAVSQMSSADPSRWSNRPREHNRSASQSHDKENDRRPSPHDKLSMSDAIPGLYVPPIAVPNFGVSTPNSFPKKIGLFSPLQLHESPVSCAAPAAAVKQEPISDADALALPHDLATHLQNTLVPHTSSSAAFPAFLAEPSVSNAAYNPPEGRYRSKVDAPPETAQEVIFTLSKAPVSVADRGKWMTAAARFRADGDLSSAIAIVSSMIHVMSSAPVRLAEAEMKPAFLMLATCYLDLGKRLQEKTGEQTDASREYARLAERYFRKVFGANKPPLSTYSTTGMTGSPAPTTSVTSTVSNDVAAADPVQPPPVNESRVAEGGDGPGNRLRTLERSLQSYKDRYSHTTTVLAAVRTGKRKLEEELADARDLRRKADEQLAQLSLDLCGARRAERHALDQCRREIESRRKAQETADALQIELRMLKEELCEKGEEMKESGEREMRWKSACAKAASLLLQAAKDESKVPERVQEPPRLR